MTGKRFDIARTRAFVSANQHLTRQQQADALGVSRDGLTRFIFRHGLERGQRGMKKPLACREPLLTIFRELDKRRITNRLILAELFVSNSTLAMWRSGQREPNLFQIECLATMAGMTLTVTKRAAVP